MNALDDLSPHPVMLAPMVGLTHYAVRASVAEFLPESAHVLWPTEMLSSKRLSSQRMNETTEVFFHDVANGLCPQLLANEEKYIRASVATLEKWGAKAIDINMGCPVRKALKHNYGVALMGDPDYAKEVVRITVANSKIPVSVKLRAGHEKHDFDYLARFIGGLQEAGASWITIHPRTAEQKRHGEAEWNLILKLKKSFKDLPIIGNGDIQTHEDILVMRENTKCDRVMIGRAMMAKPWLIRNEPEPDAYTQGDWYGKFLKSILEKMKMHYPESIGLRKMLFLIVTSKPWIEYGEYLYGRVMSSKNYDELGFALDAFFDKKQKVISKTLLRN